VGFAKASIDVQYIYMRPLEGAHNVRDFSLRRFSSKVCLTAAVLAVQSFPAFADAPRQLYNKTIKISYSASQVKTAEDGQKKNVTSAVYHMVYVSSAGRLFHRGSRATRAGMKQSDNAPGATVNAGGEATNVRFEGNRLVGDTAFAQGARRFVVTFDPGFSSCSVSVIFGRDAGGLKRRGVDGVMYTIHSMTPSGESCSISEGNAFAG
jgi:hypothetical protein